MTSDDDRLTLGVTEHCLYDPTSEVLCPPLRGWQDAGDEWIRLHDGIVHSPSLSLEMRVVGGRLRRVEPVTGNVLLATADAEQVERWRAEVERRRANDEQRRREDAEEEICRLRTCLGEA